MLILMTAHYDNVRHEKFFADLAEKQSVLLLYDTSRDIHGFTTFQVIESSFQGTTISALYSGDTIIAQHCWGQFELFRVYGRLFKTLLYKYTTPLYWFLLTKGIKTYGLLPLFFRVFYPNVATPTPAFEQHLIDHLADQKFGSAYLKEHGIVRLVPKADRLKSSLAEIPSHKRRKPYVQFFLARNPGYSHGDELVCLTRISASNFSGVAQRFVNLPGVQTCNE
jgi:hypothetical protein